MEEIRKASKSLYNFLKLKEEIEISDLIIGLGSIDKNVPLICSNIYLNNENNTIIFTGNKGKGTENINETEAEIFKEIATSKGVLNDKIFLEKQALNTYENLYFSKQMIYQEKLKNEKITIVTKPYVERRVKRIADIFFKDKKNMCYFF